METAKSDAACSNGAARSKQDVVRFGAGFLIYGILWVWAGQIGSSVLLPQRFSNIAGEVGLPAETILASMFSVGTVFALVSNIVFGALSDNCRSRFGRRTPWIVAGGLVAGAAFWWLSQTTTQLGIIAGWSVLQVGLNCTLAPALAVLSDRVPARYRGTISSLYGFGTIAGECIGKIIGAQFLTNLLPGFMIGVATWVLSGLLAVIVWPREQASVAERGEGLTLSGLLFYFKPPVRNCRDFYLALFGRLMLMFGYTAVNGYQLYILQKYIGVAEGEVAGVVSTLSLITMAISVLTTLSAGFLSDRIGRRKPLILASSCLIAAGLACPLASPTVEAMYAFAAFTGLGYGVYMSVDQALNVDVLPNPDEAGKDLGILNLANTVSQVLSPIAASSIFIATGSYRLVFPVAIAAVLAGAAIVMAIRRVR